LLDGDLLEVGGLGQPGLGEARDLDAEQVGEESVALTSRMGAR